MKHKTGLKFYLFLLLVISIPTFEPSSILASESIDKSETKKTEKEKSVSSKNTTLADLIAPPGDCECTEYIYLNEASNGEVHKLEILPGGALNEIFGGANNDKSWYPGDNVSELPSPHGLGMDLNGFLYIGETGLGDSNIRKFGCDGQIYDTNEFAIANTGTKQNIFIIDNALYNNSDDGPTVWDVCTQQQLGKVCLNDGANTNLWGLHYNPVTELFYATSRGNGNEIWIWNKAQNEQSLAGNLCIDPFINLAGRRTLFGIVSDNVGNFYVVESDLGDDVYIHKFDAAGNEINVIGPTNPSLPWGNFIGIVLSEDQQRLYLSAFTGNPARDCISIFDTDLNYVGTGMPNPPDGSGGNGKAIAIIKECCPLQDINVNQSVCSDGSGEKFYLNEIFSCGEGVVCEGEWNIQTANTNQSFDDCDFSITVNGSGCGTYVLQKTTGAGSGQRCGAFTVTVEICTEVPGSSIATARGTCTGANLNDNATISLSNVVNADQANISTGAVYTGPNYNGAGAVNTTSGSGTFVGLMHDTQYTVRIFNGADDCFMDEIITTPAFECLLSLGNRVFYDEDINGIQNGMETGIDGVTLQLLNGNGIVYDSDPNVAGIQSLTVTTAAGGYYRFDDLPAGDYIVEVAAGDFTSGGILQNYSSTDGSAQEENPNNNIDTNDNGLDMTVAGAVRSGIISLGTGNLPTGEDEPITYGAGSFTGTAGGDTESNLTVDFGFYRQQDFADCCNSPGREPCTVEPCHFISDDIYFGSSVTNETSSNPNSTADSDEDDGLILGANLDIAPGGTLRLPVFIYNNTTESAYFRMWIDWNGDGDFDDINEQVADETLAYAIYSGNFRIYQTVNVPIDATKSQILALRMRVSTDNASTTGPCGGTTCAEDGEIEDYLLRIDCEEAICTPVVLNKISG